MNKTYKPRPNEPSTVLNRELFEVVPPGIDPEKWAHYRNQYNAGARLEETLAPAELDIELNSTCNLRCSFCIQAVRDLGDHRIAFDCFKRLVDEAVSNGTLSLKLNYMNEPLIVKDLERYIEYAISAGIVNTYFSTNGIFLTKERSKSLIKSGLTKIFISLDAVTAETFEKQRHSKKFDNIVQNILSFLEIRNGLGLSYPLVRVNFLRNLLNVHEEQQFVEFWEGKADMIIIQEMNELIDTDSGIFIKVDKSDYKCSFPFKQLVVDARGRILPCCCMNGTELQLGHVDSMTLQEAWNSEKMKQLRQLHENGKFAENPTCRRCITGE